MGVNEVASRLLRIAGWTGPIIVLFYLGFDIVARLTYRDPLAEVPKVIAEMLDSADREELMALWTATTGYVGWWAEITEGAADHPSWGVTPVPDPATGHQVAVGHLERAIELAPNEPRLVLRRAMWALQGDDPSGWLGHVTPDDLARAQSLLDRAIELDPSNAYPYYLKAIIAARNGQINQTLAQVERGNRAGPINTYPLPTELREKLGWTTLVVTSPFFSFTGWVHMKEVARALATSGEADVRAGRYTSGRRKADAVMAYGENIARSADDTMDVVLGTAVRVLGSRPLYQIAVACSADELMGDLEREWRTDAYRRIAARYWSARSIDRQMVWLYGRLLLPAVVWCIGLGAALIMGWKLGACAIARLRLRGQQYEAIVFEVGVYRRILLAAVACALLLAGSVFAAALLGYNLSFLFGHVDLLKKSMITAALLLPLVLALICLLTLWRRWQSENRPQRCSLWRFLTQVPLSYKLARARLHLQAQGVVVTMLFVISLCSGVAMYPITGVELTDYFTSAGRSKIMATMAAQNQRQEAEGVRQILAGTYEVPHEAVDSSYEGIIETVREPTG